MFSIAYPADQHYVTPQTLGVPQFENAKQIQASRMRLVNLYAFNTSAAAVYLMVADVAAGAIAPGNKLAVYPIAAGSFVAISTHGGDRYENGLYLLCYNEALLTTTAGAVMFYKVDWMGYL